MKVIFISRSNLTAIIVIIAALLFAVLNAFLTKEYLTHASGSYKEDIPIYSVDTDEKKCAITFDCAGDQRYPKYSGYP